MPSSASSGRTSKAELIHALADELRKERERTHALERVCQQVDDMCRAAVEERDQDEDRLIERDKLAKQTIDQLRRHLSKARAELESATSVAYDEASHYLNLLDSGVPTARMASAELRSEQAPSSRRRTRHPGARPVQGAAEGSEAGRALSEWTELGETAQERVAKRMQRLEEELNPPKVSTNGVKFDDGRREQLRTRSPEQIAPPNGTSGSVSMDEFGMPIEVTMRQGVNGTGRQGSGWGKVFPGLNHLRSAP